MDGADDIAKEVVQNVEKLPPPPPPGEAVEQIREFLRRLADQRPQDWPEVFSDLTSLHVVVGIALCVGGLVYLLWGWRVFKILVILNAALVGAILGGAATIKLGWEEFFWIGMLAGGGLGGILAWPLVKIFVALFGGAVGAVIGSEAFKQIAFAIGREDLAPHAWVGTIGGALVLGLTVFFAFRFCVMMFTAMQGAGMFAAGALSLLLKSSRAHDPLTKFLEATPLVLLLSVVGIGLGGFLIQVFSRTNFRNGQKKAKAN